VPRGAGRADPVAALMKARDHEHAAVLWRMECGHADSRCKRWGDAMTARRPTWAPIRPEYAVAPDDWPETKAAIPAAVGADYLITIGDGVR
jgi:hypothetical protein